VRSSVGQPGLNALISQVVAGLMRRRELGRDGIMRTALRRQATAPVRPHNRDNRRAFQPPAARANPARLCVELAGQPDQPDISGRGRRLGSGLFGERVDRAGLDQAAFEHHDPFGEVQDIGRREDRPQLLVAIFAFQEGAAHQHRKAVPGRSGRRFDEVQRQLERRVRDDPVDAAISPATIGARVKSARS
jgi:hypothetical protein